MFHTYYCELDPNPWPDIVLIGLFHSNQIVFLNEEGMGVLCRIPKCILDNLLHSKTTGYQTAFLTSYNKLSFCRTFLFVFLC